MPVVASQRPYTLARCTSSAARCPGAATRVLVLHAHRLARPGRQARMDAQPRLDAGLFVSRDDELVLAQRLPLPAPLVQVQDAPGLDLEMRIARDNPSAALPGADGKVFTQPTPDRAVADARHHARALRVSRHIGHAEPRQRQAQVAGSSHASALISTVSSGGKDPRASRAGSFLQARHSLLEEALAPLADHLSALRVQARGDLVVVHAVGGHQNHLARTTSKYGNVYLVARRVSSAHSSADNSIWDGVSLASANPRRRTAYHNAIRCHLSRQTCLYL